ncbi:hypothetical protein JHK84_043606 [Glycine max]|nr:hypothetical protein JHK84_043606 [Glycine max]
MALESVGGVVLSSFLGALFQKLASPQVLDFFRGTKIDQKLRKDLESKLLSIQVVLDDAEQKQFGNVLVRDWLIKLKVAMLDVEDVLDEIQHSKLQVQPQSESQTGSGCTCKTMLAQLVYNDPRIEGKFIVKAWVCVSEEFDVLNVSRAILDTFTKSTENSDWLEIVHTKLKDKLRGNRFLLVLDDVWNESRPKWEVVQNALVCGAQGSRILVTTRSQKVASTMRSEQHHLQQLQEDYCWKLFAKHAFHDDNPQPNPGYNEIGMKIVEKCGGLPLALKSIGNLLHNKSFVSDWENILKSEIWEIEDSDIVPALAVSYHHLPPHLKTCFAYYTLFPKDYEFDKECLIQLWMAENFLHCHQGSKSPEEVGQQYFNDLLSRSFFQQSSENKEVFVMHDVLNDLGKYVCGDIYFRLEVDQAKCTQKTARYFSVAMNNKQHFDEFGTLCDTKRLLGIAICRYLNCSPSLSSYVSYLSHCSDINELPNSVCNLKHLRSLDLSHTSIKKLPDSTCSLSNLQILKLNYCRYLKEQPSNLHELTNLHRLEFVNTKIIKVPPHLGKLKNLQVSMSSFDVGKTSEFTIQQLGELNLHGRLSFWELQNIENPSDALAADLKNKTRLVELELEWNWNRNPDDSAKERDAIVIENLQPSKHLEKLSIRNYGEPRDFKSSLDGIVSIGADFHGNGTSSFPSLETLKFSSMKAWEKWECEAVIGAFPCVQYLSISKCPKLKGDLPEQLLPLKKLQISECKQLEASAPRALELDLKDFGKLQLDWASLKKLRMGGHSAETSLQEKSDTLKELYICCCPKNGILCNCEMSDNGFDSQKTFPLDFFPALRTLHLRGFHNLQMITQDHTHNHLEFLKIRECPQLESLPGSMHMLLPSLKELVIDDCPRVESFPEGGLPSNLKEMGLYKCSSGLMASLKGALGGNPSLESLGIVELDAESFPDEGLLPLSLTCLRIRDFRNLKKLDYKGLCQLSSLKKLILGNCPNLQQLPEEDFGKMQLDWAYSKNLIMGGHSMEASSLEKSDTLKELYIYCCQEYGIFCNCEMSDNGFDSQKTFPLDFFPALRTLRLIDFRNLQMITQDHSHNHLEVLAFSNCPQLEPLPGSMHMQLPSLKELTISNCPRVESFPEGGLPSNLKEMELYKCSSGLMASLKGTLGDNPSLESLGIGKLDAESFPDEGLLPLSLTCLCIRHCLNLKKLDYKGRLCQLSSLKELFLDDCPNLQQLPEEGLPKSISYLEIQG